MALLFGILFRNPDTGTCAQLGLETGSNNLYVRSMEKTGGWSDWERIGGGGSSSTTTPVTPASPTTTANAALRLVSALTLSLTGDASGSVSFNGSEGRVSLPVTVTKTAAGGGSTGSTGGGGGTGSGTGTGSGGGSSSVIMANSALRLAAPLKLTLEGDASGSVSFDGSEGVVKLQVSVAKVAGSDAVTEARAEEIARKVAAQLVEEHRRAYDHYTTNSGN